MATPLLGCLEPFDSSNEEWGAYMERMSEFLIANGVDDDRKQVAVLLSTVGPSTYRLLKDLLAPTLPSTKSFVEIQEVLQGHFQPKPLVIAERFKFHKRNQSESESVGQYLAELRKLAKTCEFKTFLEEALRDRFVCGLRTQSIQKRLLSEAALDLKKALEVAQGMEAAEQTTKHMHADSLEVHGVEPNRKGIPSKPPAPSTPCPRCGESGHWASDCRCKFMQCRKCSKTGHIARVCRSGGQKGGAANLPSRKTGKSRTSTHQLNCGEEEGDTDVGEEHSISGVHAMSQSKAACKIWVDVLLNGKPIKMELDTGASISLVNHKVWKETLASIPLEESKVVLRAYTGHQLPVLGQAMVSVEVDGQRKNLPIVVTKGSGPPLLGRNWLSEITLNWGRLRDHFVQQISAGAGRKSQGVISSTPLKLLLKEFCDLFQKGLGEMGKLKARISLKEGASPKFFKPRAVPYALREKIEEDLKRLEHLGVISQIYHSEWAAPVVPVIKASGAVRICGDFKITVNPQLEVEQYPLPKAEDLFTSLEGGERFTTLDLADAYLQMPLDPQAKQYLVINTHKGLYQYHRLPFGVSSAPALFQRAMDTILQGLRGVVCYIDDILVTGANTEEHLSNLEKVFLRLREHGLRLKLDKCHFLGESVEYLGYVINKEGIHTSPKKVQAVLDAPPPKDLGELRSFLGLVNYYGKFIRNLSELAAPLNQLLQKTMKWNWTSTCQQSFQALKKALTSAEVLCHYNPRLSLSLACDASSVGIGAVIFHSFENGTERPIAYASRTLTSAEKNYSQIEREALGIVYGLKKFHQYLYGRKFTLITDHKPLVTIFGPTTSLSTMAASRLQRWALILSGYYYTIQYKPTAQHGNADALSRLPQVTTPDELCLDQEVHAIQRVVEKLPIRATDIQRATRRDPVLSQVLRYTVHGWPTGDVAAELKPFIHHRLELTTENDCLLWGMRVIIPEQFRQQVLNELHQSHPGIVRMKSMARIYVWWPGIDREIEALVRGCESCSQNRDCPQMAPLHSWEYPRNPWQRLHVDFAGPFCAKMWLIVVDARTKWPEVIPMETITTTKTVQALRTMFAHWGLPEQIVSDNGPQFTSEEFKQFCGLNGIRHVLVAPYHPRSNGEAERFVKTFKLAFRAMKGEDLSKRLDQFLFSYRNTPHTTTGYSPAQLLLGRRLRSKLDLLVPRVESKVEAAQLGQQKYHDVKAKARTFDAGQSVWAQNYRSGEKWLPGVVLERVGPVSYRVEVQGQIWRRHVDQLLQREERAGDSPTSDPVILNDVPLTGKLPLPPVIPPVESAVPAASEFTAVLPSTASSEGELPGVLERPPNSPSFATSDSAALPPSSPSGSKVLSSPSPGAVEGTTVLTVPPGSPTVPSGSQIAPRRNPQRERKAPSRYRDFVHH